MQKRCKFTIIEILVAMSIFSISFFSILNIYKVFIKKTRANEKILNYTESLISFDLVLRDLFKRVNSKSKLYLDNKNLFFTISNNIDINPDFNGFVTYELLFNDNKLFLVLHNKENQKNLIVIDDVLNIKYNFLYHFGLLEQRVNNLFAKPIIILLNLETKYGEIDMFFELSYKAHNADLPVFL